MNDLSIGETRLIEVRDPAFPDPRDVLGAIRLALLLRALADDAALLETIAIILDHAEPTPQEATQPTHLLVDAVAVHNDRRRAERAQGESKPRPSGDDRGSTAADPPSPAEPGVDNARDRLR